MTVLFRRGFVFYFDRAQCFCHFAKYEVQSTGVVLEGQFLSEEKKGLGYGRITALMVRNNPFGHQRQRY